jgi:transposase
MQGAFGRSLERSANMRPEKITLEMIEEICEYIAQGYSFATSAKLAGISASTFFRWKAEGQSESASDLHRAFELQVREATAFSESEALQIIRSSALIDNNWKAAAWFLERRFPETYKRTQINRDENELRDKGDGEANVAKAS